GPSNPGSAPPFLSQGTGTRPFLPSSALLYSGEAQNKKESTLTAYGYHATTSGSIPPAPFLTLVPSSPAPVLTQKQVESYPPVPPARPPLRSGPHPPFVSHPAPAPLP